MIYESHSPEETMKLARTLGKQAKSGDIFCLQGDLGVGKTMFTKGFAVGMGITEHITSPTFTVINEYTENRLHLYHFDVYRITDIDEMYDIGFEEYIYGEGVTFIEWANYIHEIIPKEAIWIVIKKDLEKGLDYRLIEIDD